MTHTLYMFVMQLYILIPTKTLIKYSHECVILLIYVNAVNLLLSAF